MLDNCKLVVCDSHDDLKREGIQSLTIAGNILQFKNPPSLEGQTEEKRGDEDNTNTKHTYWFILRTPSSSITAYPLTLEFSFSSFCTFTLVTCISSLLKLFLYIFY